MIHSKEFYMLFDVTLVLEEKFGVVNWLYSPGNGEVGSVITSRKEVELSTYIPEQFVIGNKYMCKKIIEIRISPAVVKEFDGDIDGDMVFGDDELLF